MATLAGSLMVVLNILKVVFGLGFVIFLHELGHFLAAKWAGVKVEKFFLGFDPYGMRLATFKYGETTYGIGALPLGGYVKMLGEDPGEGEERSSDPRAFSNKSVGARTVILSAGVAMNVLLGLVLFTITHALGVQEMPAKIGTVEAGSPAYEAGLRNGDEIVAIDGKSQITFDRMKLKVSLSSNKQRLDFTVRRPGVAEPLSLPIVPERRDKADAPNIGVTPSRSLTLFKEKTYIEPPGVDGPAPKEADLPGGGTVVAAGPAGGPSVPVDDLQTFDRVLAEHRDVPVEVTVEAPVKPGTAGTPARTRAVLPVVHELTLGLRLTPGPVTSIQKDSPAERAGFRKGDRIVKVDGHDDFDPMGLPDDLFARAGKPTTIVVERKEGDKITTADLVAMPDASVPGVDLRVFPTEALKLPGLGLAMVVEPKVAAVAEGSPAAKHGIKAGAVLRGITLPAVPDEPKAKPSHLVFRPVEKTDKDAEEASWPYAWWLLQNLPGQVSLEIDGASTPTLLTPEPDKAHNRTRRGLLLMPIIVDVPAQSFGVALRRGWDETYDNVVSIYAMIRSLFGGRVSPKNLAGLPRIAGIAYETASQTSIVPLLTFLGMLSINLAVLNFLPIPPLDGGQIAFLIAEKIRGKPLPETTLFIFMIGGIALVGCLMLYTIIQDIIILIFKGS